MLTLYQAEWCPYSSAVRERLTELGLRFVAVPVEPRPEQRETLREHVGTDEIPVLETEDGRFHRGTDEIFEYLATQPEPATAADHRERFAEHRVERDVETAKLLDALD